jgi:hypothetical protein
MRPQGGAGTGLRGLWLANDVFVFVWLLGNLVPHSLRIYALFDGKKPKE